MLGTVKGTEVSMSLGHHTIQRDVCAAPALPFSGRFPYLTGLLYKLHGIVKWNREMLSCVAERFRTDRIKLMHIQGYVRCDRI